MYFDAVLNAAMEPLFNGTPSETEAWLEENETDDSIRICVGKTMQILSVADYLNL